MLNRGMVHVFVGGYIVYHICLTFFALQPNQEEDYGLWYLKSLSINILETVYPCVNVYDVLYTVSQG